MRPLMDPKKENRPPKNRNLKQKPLPLELTAEDAGKALSLSSKTIRNLIHRNVLKGKKVGGKWFVERKSVLDYRAYETKNHPTSAPSHLHGPRKLAVYRLCLHVFETFPWHHSLPEVQEALQAKKLRVIGELGAGFYHFGKRKQHHYKNARSALGSMVAFLDAYPEKHLEKARLFMEEECLPAMGSLLRKLEQHAGGKNLGSPSEPAPPLC